MTGMQDLLIGALLCLGMAALPAPADDNTSPAVTLAQRVVVVMPPEAVPLSPPAGSDAPAVAVPPNVVRKIEALLRSEINHPNVRLVDRGDLSVYDWERKIQEAWNRQTSTPGAPMKLLEPNCMLRSRIYREPNGQSFMELTLTASSGAEASVILACDVTRRTMSDTDEDLRQGVQELLTRMQLRVEAPQAPAIRAPTPVDVMNTQPFVPRPGTPQALRMQLQDGRHVLRPGENFALELDCGMSGFLTVLQMDANGQVRTLEPAGPKAEPVRVRTGQKISVPQDVRARFRARDPGLLRLKALITREPLDLGSPQAIAQAMKQLTQSSESWATAELSCVVSASDQASAPVIQPTADSRAPSAPPAPVEGASPATPAPTSEPSLDPSHARPSEPPQDSGSGVKDVQSRLQDALNDVRRSVEPRLPLACRTLGWVRNRPQDWPASWNPPSIGWAPLPKGVKVPDIAVIDADFDPDDALLTRAFSSMKPAVREQLRAEIRKVEDPDYRHGNRVCSLIAGEAPWLPALLPGTTVRTYRAAANTGARSPDAAWRIQAGSEEEVLAGLRQAMADGCRVVNLSLSFPKPSATFTDDPVWNRLDNAGVLLVCAAGNNRENLDTADGAAPQSLASRHSNILVVGASDLDGSIWKNPRTGLGSAMGARGVHLLAPGCGLPVSDGAGMPALAEEGTSYAAPLAAATAAAWMALHPSWTPQQVIERMVATSQPVADTGVRCRGGLLRWPTQAELAAAGH